MDLSFLTPKFFKCPSCGRQEVVYNLSYAACVSCRWHSRIADIPRVDIPPAMAAGIGSMATGWDGGKIFYLREDAGGETEEFIAAAAQRMSYFAEIDYISKMEDWMFEDLADRSRDFELKVGSAVFGGFFEGPMGSPEWGLVNVTHKRLISSIGSSVPRGVMESIAQDGVPAKDVAIGMARYFGSWENAIEIGASMGGGISFGIVDKNGLEGARLPAGMVEEILGGEPADAWAVVRVFSYNSPPFAVVGGCSIDEDGYVSKVSMAPYMHACRSYFSSGHSTIGGLSIFDSAIGQPIAWGAIDFCDGELTPRFLRVAKSGSAIGTFFMSDSMSGPKMKWAAVDLEKRSYVKCLEAEIDMDAGEGDAGLNIDADIDAARRFADAKCEELEMETSSEYTWEHSDGCFCPIWQIRMDKRIWDDVGVLKKLADRGPA